MKKKPSRKVAENHGQFGVTHFIDLIDQLPEATWCIIGVESPLDAAIGVYSELAECERSWRNVEIRLAREKDIGGDPLVPIVQPVDSKWSLIYRVIGWPWSDFEEAMSKAQTISAKLKTIAVAFIGHDTSGAMDYYFYKNGHKAGQHSWEYRGDPSDKEFAALKLYVPACFARRESGKPWLAVLQSSLNRIERADIIEIKDF